MRNFHVSALWDKEAQVFYSESDIIGLHVEAKTIDEFKEVMMALAPELIMENHLSIDDLSKKPIVDLIPSIFFQSPNSDHVPA